MRFLGFAIFLVRCSAKSPDTPSSALLQDERPKGSLHKLNAPAKVAEDAQKSSSKDASDTVAEPPPNMEDPVARALMAASTVYVNADVDKKRRIASQQRDKAAIESEAARKKAEQVHKEVVAQQGRASKQMAEALKREAVVAAGQGVAVDHDTMAVARDTLVKEELKKQKDKEAAAAAVPKEKPVDSPAMTALNKALMDIQGELVSKEKDLKVQTELAGEKETAAKDAKLLEEKLKKQTDEYQREADVAKQIAEEKAGMAGKSKKQEDAAEKKFEDSDAEEKEAEKFLKQTRSEVQVLQDNAKATRQKKIGLQKTEAASRKKKAEALKAHALEEAAKAQKDAEAATKDENEAAAAAEEHKAELKEETKEETKAPEPKAIEKNEAASKAATKPLLTKEKNAPMSEDAVRKLLEENERLKKEKEELESQLHQKKVQQEKAKLKQKLKNKLAVVDRHSKVVKAKKV